MREADKKSTVRRGKHESGQAIIFIALLMVALGGMTGLAIDGGGLFYLHRDTQNAADAAVLAATYALCTGAVGAQVEEAGYEGASQNGFIYNPLDYPGGSIDQYPSWVEVHSPPISEPAASRSDADEFVEVRITAIKPSYFIQLVYRGQPLMVTSSGMGKCTPPNSTLLPPAALVSLSTSKCQALTVSGTGSLTVTNSGIFVNSTATDQNNNCYSIKSNNNAADLDTYEPIAVGGSGTHCQDVNESNLAEGTTIECGPRQQISSDPLEKIEPPTSSCVGTAQNQPSGSTLAPGHYNSIRNTGGTLTLLPGIYCTYSLSLSAGSTTIGENIVIYIPSRDTSKWPDGGGVTVNGSATVQLAAPNAAYCDDPAHEEETVCGWEGLLIWSDAGPYSGSGGDIHLNGSGTSSYEGMIYAPNVTCHLNGGADGYSIEGQVLCETVSIEGNGDLTLTYAPAAFLDTPPTIGMVQ